MTLYVVYEEHKYYWNDYDSEFCSMHYTLEGALKAVDKLFKEEVEYALLHADFGIPDFNYEKHTVLQDGVIKRFYYETIELED